VLDLLIQGAIIVIGGGLIGGVTSHFVQRRRGRSLALRSQIGCSIRVTEGDVPGVKPGRWQTGTATLGSGTFEYHRGLLGNWGRRLGGQTVNLRDVTIGPDRRPTKGREQLWAMGTVLDLHAPSVRLEWVVAPNQADWAGR